MFECFGKTDFFNRIGRFLPVATGSYGFWIQPVAKRGLQKAKRTAKRCKNGQCDIPEPQQSPVAKPIATTQIAQPAPPAPPGVAYETLPVSAERAGPFTTQTKGMGTALNYQSRAGVVNLMESIVEQAEYTGYVSIEKAYTFGPSKYVVVVSTGEGGNGCPASTYVFSFDSKAERVDGTREVDGCSELVEAVAEGNKLTVKKEGGVTVVYNGVVDQ